MTPVSAWEALGATIGLPPVTFVYLASLAVCGAAWTLRYWWDGPSWAEEKHCREQGRGWMRGHLTLCRSTPDSERYLAMGQGVRQCWPFHARFLIPWLCRDCSRWWHAVTAGSLIATGPALAWFGLQSGLNEAQALAVVVAFTGLWGAFGLLTLCPVLVDAPAMLVALVGATLYLQGLGLAALLPCALVLGSIKETGPGWLALFAWSPWPLVGLAVPAYRRWAVPHPPADHTIIANPVLSAMMYRRGTLWDGRVMVLPLGIGLLALLNPSPQLWACLLFGYAQTLVASDVQRLVHVAGPVILVHAIPVVPVEWLPLLLVAHLFSPWAKSKFEEQPVRIQGVQ